MSPHDEQAQGCRINQGVMTPMDYSMVLSLLALLKSFQMSMRN